MYKPLLVVKNNAMEGAGLFESVLDEQHVPFDVIDLDAGDHWPQLSTIGGLLVMGGPDSANDDNDKMRTELVNIRTALEMKLPYLGVCLGLQTLVKAAGGRVRTNKVREIGVLDPEGQPFTIEVTEDGRKDPLLEGIESSATIFHLHGETVDVTEGMTILATGKWCANQIVRVAPNAYGIQGHWDIYDDILDEWATLDPDLRQMQKDKLDADWKVIATASMRTGRTMFANFLKIAGLSQ